MNLLAAAQSDRASKLLLTPIEAAEALSISRSHLYDLIVHRRIFSVKVGGSRRIPLQALQAYVAELCDHETERTR